MRFCKRESGRPRRGAKARTRKEDVNEASSSNAAEYKAAEPFLERGIRALLQETPHRYRGAERRRAENARSELLLEFPERTVALSRWE